jgi:predicted nucleic acid-binding protein
MTMERAFVDTGYFVARLAPRDQWHERAVAQPVPREAVTSSLVINETISLLQARGLFPAALTFLRRVRQQPNLRIVYPDVALQDGAWNLFRKHGSHGANAVDCVSFAIMNELSIRKALTFDTHFRAAGFEVLV